MPQSFEFDEQSQDTGDKCGKRTSPTCSSSPSESFKFKRTKDGFDKDDSSHVKVRFTTRAVKIHFLTIRYMYIHVSRYKCHDTIHNLAPLFNK